MPPAVDLTPVSFLTRADLDPVPLLLIAASTWWYLRAVRRRRAAGLAWPPARVAALFWAEVLLLAGVASGLAWAGTTNFTAYGVQLVLVGVCAPALLALAAPLTLLVETSGPVGRARVRRALHSLPVRVLTNPFAAWLLWAAGLFVLYFTGLYADSLASGPVRELVYLAWLVTGFLFYWPVVDADPLPRRLGYWPRILYLLLTFPLWAILGMALESQTSAIAPGIALTDLHVGAAVIWVAGETVALLGAIWLFIEWLRADERSAAQRDAVNEEAAARQLALWRAAREAAARAASP